MGIRVGYITEKMAENLNAKREEQVENLMENSLNMVEMAVSYERAALEIWSFINAYLCIRFWFLYLALGICHTGDMK